MEEVGEAEVVAACSAGRVLECGDSGTRRSVDAVLLRRCCAELRDRIDRHGVRLRDAVITGSLDFSGLDVPFPLRFEGCEFDSPLTVEGAQLYELALTGCIRLPGLLANGVRIRRDLDLSRTHVTGALRTAASTSKRAAIWLCESEIGGPLLCVDTVIDGGAERSIQADRMHVSGNIRLLHKFTTRGELRLIGARIDGSFRSGRSAPDRRVARPVARLKDQQARCPRRARDARGEGRDGAVRRPAGALAWPAVAWAGRVSRTWAVVWPWGGM
jgi:hypothetical protein